MTKKEESQILTEDQVNSLLEPLCSQDGKDKIKTLIVEDDYTTRLLYDRGLFNQIFDKKMVISGKEAILVYDEWRPDIILLDIYLPEISGYQILKEIRTTIEDKKTTIVMATSLSDKEDVLSCMKLGIEGYIVKPFSCSELGVKILGYYAKKEPERAQKVETLCREIAKQSQIKLLLDKGKSKTNEIAEGLRVGTSDMETGQAGGEKETGKTPAEKETD
jgi:PleD family two-component response regulator